MTLSPGAIPIYTIDTMMKDQVLNDINEKNM